MIWTSHVRRPHREHHRFIHDLQEKWHIPNKDPRLEGFSIARPETTSINLQFSRLARDVDAQSKQRFQNLLMLDDGTAFKEVLAYLMNSQHSEPKLSREHHALEMML